MLNLSKEDIDWDNNLIREIEELILLLIYLTSWEEESFGHKVLCSCKEYPFEVLNTSKDKNLIAGSKRFRSVYLTENGIKKIKQIEKKSEGIIFFVGPTIELY